MIRRILRRIPRLQAVICPVTLRGTGGLDISKYTYKTYVHTCVVYRYVSMISIK